MNTINYGIDLGTTNSAICHLNGNSPILDVTDCGHSTMPSCVAVCENGDFLVGEYALDTRKSLLNRAVTTMNPADTNSFIEFKRAMGTDTKYRSKFLNYELTPEELSAHILIALKSFAEKGMDLKPNENLNSIVITVPAKFTPAQNNATVKAAQLAGFQQIELLQEPIAAVLFYGLQANNKNGLWLVFDFGGGTFDAALVSAQDGALKIIDSEGDNQLGGKNLDEAIVDRIIIPFIKQRYEVNNILANHDKHEILRAWLKPYAEIAKKHFSFHNQHPISIQSRLNEPVAFDELGKEIDLDIAISQSDMIHVLEPYFQQAINHAINLIRRNNRTTDSIDAIMLVGGTAYSPLLKQMLKEQISNNLLADDDLLTVVAKGAAIYASTFPINKKNSENSENKKNSENSENKKNSENSENSENSKNSENKKNKENSENKENKEPFPLSTTFPTSTIEHTAEALIKLNAPLSNPVNLKITRNDGNSSELNNLNPQAPALVEIELLPNTANEFTVEISDADTGISLPCSNDSFKILQGIVAPEPTLPYNIGIAKFFEDEDDILFCPVPHLEKNRNLPAKGELNGLRTRSDILKDNPNTYFKVPVYQGDFNTKKTDLHLNNLVCEIIISGNDLPENLPANSPVNIAIHIDSSQSMHFSASFPSLNFQTAPLQISPVRIKPPKADELWLNIYDNSYAMLNAKEEKLLELVSQLENLQELFTFEAGSDDGRLNIQEKLRKILIQLPRRKWLETKKKLLDNLNNLNNILNLYNKALPQEFNPDAINASIKNQSVKETENLLYDIIQHYNFIRDIENDGEAMAEEINFYHTRFYELRWTDPNQALQLIKEALQCQSPNRYNKLTPLYQKISSLRLPPLEYQDTLT